MMNGLYGRVWCLRCVIIFIPRRMARLWKLFRRQVGIVAFSGGRCWPRVQLTDNWNCTKYMYLKNYADAFEWSFI